MDLDSMIKTIKNIYKVCDAYGFGTNITDIGLILNGHINETYRVSIGEEEHRYVFQKVNSYIFKEPKQIMNNIATVTAWLECHDSPVDCQILSYISNKFGDNYLILDDGSFWRVSEQVQHSITYEKVESPEILRGAGYAFGRFQYLLDGLPADDLCETIPDFHNTVKRAETLFQTAELDRLGRAESVKKELQFFEDNFEAFSRLEKMKESGEIPTRVAHNDTKINNILFNRITGAPLAVIDLDTIMPGLSAHDYGDAVRCAANFSAEDETDLDKVGLDFVYFDAFTQGFITATKEILTPKEVEYMALGAPTIAYELAARFLTDYIDGDRYFRIHRDGHNLDRARCQMRLCEDMMYNYDRMCSTVEHFYS